MLGHRGAGPFSQLVPSTALLPRAAHWCLELDHPADHCLYVALAERERATLITADQRLLRKLQTSKPGLPAAIDLACLTENRRQEALSRLEDAAASCQSSSVEPWTSGNP
jgi:hypothetical protein